VSFLRRGQIAESSNSCTRLLPLLPFSLSFPNNPIPPLSSGISVSWTGGLRTCFLFPRFPSSYDHSLLERCSGRIFSLSPLPLSASPDLISLPSLASFLPSLPRIQRRVFPRPPLFSSIVRHFWSSTNYPSFSRCTPPGFYRSPPAPFYLKAASCLCFKIFSNPNFPRKLSIVDPSLTFSEQVLVSPLFTFAIIRIRD